MVEFRGNILFFLFLNSTTPTGQREAVDRNVRSKHSLVRTGAHWARRQRTPAPHCGLLRIAQPIAFSLARGAEYQQDHHFAYLDSEAIDIAGNAAETALGEVVKEQSRAHRQHNGHYRPPVKKIERQRQR